MTYVSYNEIECSIGCTTSYPRKEYRWRAYKDGECKEFDNKTEAETHSKLVERYQANKEEYDQQSHQFRLERQKIFDIWFGKLREYFDRFDDDEFDIMYSYAYDRGHSSGYDEVFYYMCDFVEIVDKFREIYKNKSYNNDLK